jgi:hypothetical protein
MRFTASKEDFAKGQPVNLGYHPAVITGATPQMSKGQDAAGNPKDKVEGIKVEFTIVAGPNKGRKLYNSFWENGQGFILAFLRNGLGEKIDETQPYTGELTEATLKGQKLDILVEKSFGASTPGQTPKEYRNINGYRLFSGSVADVESTLNS